MTIDGTIGPGEATRITAYLDIEAPPVGPSAHIVFGTNQMAPAEVVARRYHDGLAPLIILTGGVNRHTGVVEAHEHREVLRRRGVPDQVIRYEDASTTTQANVASALPLIREALSCGLTLTAVAKWYHRRSVMLLRALLPEVAMFHAVTWEPVYDGTRVTRTGWWTGSPTAMHRVLREWRVIPERLAAGSLSEVTLVDGAWR